MRTIDIQADLYLCWLHRSYCKFCHALAQIIRKHNSRVMGKKPCLNMRTAKVQASRRICAVSAEPLLFPQVCSIPRENQPKNSLRKHDYSNILQISSPKIESC